MYVCTKDFRIRGLGSFLKFTLLSLGKYTPGYLLWGPLMILLLKCNSKQSPSSGLNFIMPL